MRGETRFAVLIVALVAIYAAFRSFGEGRGVERFLLRMGVLDDVTVFVDPPAPLSSGTAFHLGGGRWATALHVVDACSRIGLREGEGRRFDEARLASTAVMADSALIEAPGEAPALRLAASPPERGTLVSLVGYPQGRPATVRARYLGPAIVRMRGGADGTRFDERQLLFEEVSRAPAFRGALGGLSGGPAVTDAGEVVGLASAASLDGRRILVSPASSLIELLGGDGGAAFEQDAASADAGDWRRSGEALRKGGAVRFAACVGATS